MAASKEQTKKTLSEKTTDPKTGQLQNTQNASAKAPAPLLFIQPKETAATSVNRKNDDAEKRTVTSASYPLKIKTAIQWVLENNDFEKAIGFSSLSKNKALIEAIMSKKLDSVKKLLLTPKDIAEAVSGYAEAFLSNSKNATEVAAQAVLANSMPAVAVGTQIVLSDGEKTAATALLTVQPTQSELKKKVDITTRKIGDVVLVDSKEKADINTITFGKEHYNALQLAVIYRWENLDVFQLLIDSGINIEYTTPKGENIWSIAKGGGRQDVLGLLIKKPLGVGSVNSGLTTTCKNSPKSI